jgi:hypothetical protein
MCILCLGHFSPLLPAPSLTPPQPPPSPPSPSLPGRNCFALISNFDQLCLELISDVAIVTPIPQVDLVAPGLSWRHSILLHLLPQLSEQGSK